MRTPGPLATIRESCHSTLMLLVMSDPVMYWLTTLVFRPGMIAFE